MVREIHTHKKAPHEIDRDSYEPAYLQLANLLRRQVMEGVFRPGDQLPSEAQLVQRYGLSAMTVRRSINLLADQGVVSTAQGRGTFVKALELNTATFGLEELKDLFSQSDGSIVRLLDVRVVSADERTARKLNVSPGETVIYIRRLFNRSDEPIFYHRGYLIYDPTRPIVEAEMDVTSLQGLFTQGNNNVLMRGQLTIEATLMNSEEAEILKKTLPAAAFYLEHLFYDFDDCPISWGWFIFPSDRLHFSTKVGPYG